MAGFMAGSIVGKMVLDRSKWAGGVKAVGKDTKTMGGWVKQNSKQFKAMGLAIAAVGTIAIATFSKMIKKFVETGDMIDKMSKRTGFAAETLSELAHAADISGADITALEKGVKKMSKSIVDASFGLETYLRVFRGLGLEIEDLLALNPEEQFLKIGNAIADMENDTLRTAAAVDVFGRAGTLLIPLFKEGSEGIKKLREEAHKLGIVFDEEAAAKAAKLKDAQTNLKAAFQGFGFSLAEEFVPILTNVADTFTDMVVDMRGNAKFLIEGLLQMFELAAKGIQSLMLAWHGLQNLVFKTAEMLGKVVELQIKFITAPLQLLSKIKGVLGEPARRMLEGTGKLLENLTVITKGWNEEGEKQVEVLADIIEGFEPFFAALNKIKTGLTKGKEEVKTYGETIIETLIPPMKEQNALLWEAIQAHIKLTEAKEEEAAATEKTIELTEAENLAFRTLMNERMAGLDMLMGTFETWVTQGGDLMGHLGNMMKKMTQSMIGSLRQLTIEIVASASRDILAQQAKALAGIIASVVSAIPFPFNIAAIGLGIGLINKFFAGLPSFAEGGEIGRRGGIVGEEGPELFVPDRPGTIIPLKEGVGPMKQVTNVFSPNIYLNTLDPMTARDVVRDQIIPELFEAWKNKIGLRETQEALEIF